MTIFSISRARLVKMHRSSFHVRDCFFFLFGAPLKRKKDAAEKGQRQAGSEQLESAGPKYNPPTHLLLLLYIYIYISNTYMNPFRSCCRRRINKETASHTQAAHTHTKDLLSLSLSVYLEAGEEEEEEEAEGGNWRINLGL